MGCSSTWTTLASSGDGERGGQVVDGRVPRRPREGHGPIRLERGGTGAQHLDEAQVLADHVLEQLAQVPGGARRLARQVGDSDALDERRGGGERLAVHGQVVGGGHATR